MTTTTATRIPQVGEILTASWGYDATFIDYYKVLKVTNSTVTLVEIEPAISETVDVCSVSVVPTEEVKGEPFRRKFIAGDDYYYVRINDYKNARTWKGEALRQTAFGWY